MDYYYADASGQPAGPVPLDTLAQWIASGNLLPSTQVVAVGDSVWQPLASLVMLSYQGADGNAAGPVTLDAVLRMRAAGTLTADSWVLPAGAAQWVPLTSVVPAHFQPQPQAAPARQTAPVPRPGARPAARRQAAAPQHHGHPHHHAHYGPGGVSRAAYAITAISVQLLTIGLTIWLMMSAWTTFKEAMATGNAQPDFNALITGSVLFWAVSVIGGLVVLVLGCLRIVNIGWPGVYCLFLFVPIVNIYFWVGCLCFPENYARHRQLDSPARMGLAALGLFIVLAIAGVVLTVRRIEPEIERLQKQATERLEKAKADAEAEARAEQLRNTLPSGQPN